MDEGMEGRERVEIELEGSKKIWNTGMEKGK